MKIYALTKVDGGVVILLIYSPKATVESEIAKWHPDVRVEVTGEYREISAEDIPADRSQRQAWKPDFTLDESKIKAVLVK